MRQTEGLQVLAAQLALSTDLLGPQGHSDLKLKNRIESFSRQLPAFFTISNDGVRVDHVVLAVLVVQRDNRPLQTRHLHLGLDGLRITLQLS